MVEGKYVVMKVSKTRAIGAPIISIWIKCTLRIEKGLKIENKSL